MKIICAGYNVDIEALKEYKKKDTILTPESISAAYARISRSPKSVEILRNDARKAVEQARRSNRAIIFGMGHHSIAEHAVFNFDIIGISRRAVEELEHYRLCSYTEKSQRYVTLEGDYVIPKEIQRARLTRKFNDTVRTQNELYVRLFQKMYHYHIKAQHPRECTENEKQKLENCAKEDARYVLSLATQTQLGATINARNLELIIRRCASHNLEEMRELGQKLYKSVQDIAPSILLFHQANDYDEKTYAEVARYVQKIGSKKKMKKENEVILIDATRDADDRILAALVFRTSQQSYRTSLKTVKKMTKKQRIELFKKACQHMELFDVALREFECAQLTYSLIVSAGCFGQLKRHRIATILSQEYDLACGYTMPEIVRKLGEVKRFEQVIKESERCYRCIEKKTPGIGTYILTNAHRRRVLMSFNLRELYHISRLREDSTAQWDIRHIAEQMSRQARKAMPICTLLLGAKEDFPAAYARLFNRQPKVTQVPKP
jgi:flavin-dependent thymidylate synthase